MNRQLNSFDTDTDTLYLGAPDVARLVARKGLPACIAEVAERMNLQRDTVAKRWLGLRARAAQFGAPKDMMVGE